jgi:protoporphyrinogen oxidase
MTVLERSDRVGGNAGSFEIDGVHADYGSHRLHPSCDPRILSDLRHLLGPDLLKRPRHGRIRLRSRWIHFPLRPLDLLLSLPSGFATGIVLDLLTKILPREQNGKETFASVLENGLGPTICRDFYFPYARKLWGVSPDELSATQARRRVSAGSIKKVIQRLARAMPGLRGENTGYFFYPRCGYGQISETLFRAAQTAGAQFVFGATVTSVEHDGKGVTGVHYEREGKEHRIPTRRVWSTIPISLLVRILKPSAPPEVIEAASGVSFRGMILIYLVLGQKRFTEYDAHYFPEEAIPISRLSEPKNYSDSGEPADLTVLCAELPCDPGSPTWRLSDPELGDLVRRALETAGLPIKAPLRRIVTKRIGQAYPIYRRGYEEHFETMDRYLAGLEGILTFGRQGLFVHDNTHHALYMAYAAAECLDNNGRFNQEKWRAYREVFESHVVED